MNPQTTILIVEDERIPAEFLKIFLQRQWYDVVAIFDTGEEAIQVSLLL